MGPNKTPQFPEMSSSCPFDSSSGLERLPFDSEIASSSSRQYVSNPYSLGVYTTTTPLGMPPDYLVTSMDANRNNNNTDLGSENNVHALTNPDPDPPP